MGMIEDIKFWAMVIILLPFICVIAIWYWFMVNVIHKDLADEEEKWIYDY